MRSLSAFLLVLGVICLSFAGVARLVDPRGDFGVGIFPLVTLDSRREKMRLFEKSTSSAGIGGLILGSSRSMKLEPKELETRLGTRFFNFAVDSAHAEDYLAIYRWTRTRSVAPRYVILGLDVEALHDDDVQDRRLAENSELIAALARDTSEWSILQRTIDEMVKYKEVFTAANAADIARSMDRFLQPRERHTLAAEFATDGFLHYLKFERDRARGTFNLDEEISKSLPEYVNRFRSMHSLSAGRKQVLERLIRQAQGDGAVFKIWLTTLHPQTVRYLAERTSYLRLLADTRTYLEQLRDAYGIEVYDYSEPGLYSGSLTGWYDGAHIDETNAALVAAGLAAARPGAGAK